MLRMRHQRITLNAAMTARHLRWSLHFVCEVHAIYSTIQKPSTVNMIYATVGRRYVTVNIPSVADTTTCSLNPMCPCSVCPTCPMLHVWPTCPVPVSLWNPAMFSREINTPDLLESQQIVSLPQPPHGMSLEDNECTSAGSDEEASKVLGKPAHPSLCADILQPRPQSYHKTCAVR